MELDIRKKNMQWSDALASHTTERLHARLDHLSERVRRVFVRLVDVNGPRGGVDKKCSIVARMKSGQLIHASSKDECPYRAVDHAVNRLKQSVTRYRGKKRERRRTTPE